MSETNGGVVWDLTSYFPGFNGPEMLAFKEQLAKDVAAVVERAGEAGNLSAATYDEWEALILLAEDISARLGHVFSYVGNLSAADAANEAYPLEEAGLIRFSAEFGKFSVNFLQALKATSDEVFNAFLARPKLDGVQHQLRRTRETAQKTMSREMEILANDLERRRLLRLGPALRQGDGQAGVRDALARRAAWKRCRSRAGAR